LLRRSHILVFDLFRVGKYIAYLCYSLQICKEILVFLLYYFTLALIRIGSCPCSCRPDLLTQNGNKKVEIVLKTAQENEENSCADLVYGLYVEII